MFGNCQRCSVHSGAWKPRATRQAKPTPAELALDGFVTALDHLIEVADEGGLDGFDGMRLIEFLQRFEQTRNRTALLDHRALRVAETVRLPDTVGQPDLKTVLTWALRLSPAEAARRIRAAEQVGEGMAMTGEPLEPRRPALAQAQRTGHASPEQLDLCLRALEKVDHRGFDPADLDGADRLLGAVRVHIRAEKSSASSRLRSSTGSTPTAADPTTT